MHLNHPFILLSILFKGDVLFGLGAEDEDALEVDGGGRAEAALLLAYVILVMDPDEGELPFPYLGPLYLQLPLIW